MKNLIRNSLFLLFLFAGTVVFSQKRDTVIVYNYVYITDTVWVEKPVGKREIIAIEFLSRIDSCVSSSSINPLFEDSAFSMEIRSQPELKRKPLSSFFFVGVTPFAFPRNLYSVKAGGNLMFLEHNASTISLSPWIGFHLGFDYGRRIKSTGFFWMTGLDFQYGDKVTQFYQAGELDASLSEFEYEFAKQKMSKLLDELNKGAFTQSYFGLSIPIKCSYRFYNIIPYAGVDFSYSNYFLYGNNTLTNTYEYFDIEIPFGLTCYFNNHFGVELEGIQSITSKDNGIENTVSGLGESNISFLTLKLNFSIVYSF